MEGSWRFRPIQGNICPICSTSHFPFCSQPTSFDRNVFGGAGLSRSSLENDPFFHRPVLDPFLDSRGAPETPHPLSHWYRNRNLDRDSFRQFPNPSQMADSAMYSGIHRDGFHPQRFDHGTNHKRMKVDDTSLGSFAQVPPAIHSGLYSNSTRILSEDERRLNLIRDHGGTNSGGQLQHGMNSSIETGLGSVRGLNGYCREGSVHERNFINADVGEHGNNLGGSRSIRSDWQPKPPSTAGTSNFHDPRYGSAEMKGPFLHPETMLDLHNHFTREKVYDENRELHRGEQGSGFDQQHMQNNRNGFRTDVGYASNLKGEGDKDSFLYSPTEQHQQSHYAQIETFLHPSVQHHGPSNAAIGANKYVNAGQQTQDLSALQLQRDEEYWHNLNLGDRSFSSSLKSELNKQPHISHPKEYHAYNLQQLTQKELMPVKESQYPHVTNWQMPSGLSTHHEQKSYNLPVENCSPNAQLPHSYTLHHPVENKQDLHFFSQQGDVRQSFDVKPPQPENIQGSIGHQNLPMAEQFGAPNMSKPGNYVPISTGSSTSSTMPGQASPVFGIYPPLPPLPPPPLPVDQPEPPPSHPQVTSLPQTSSLLYPIPASSSPILPLFHSPDPEIQPLSHTYARNRTHFHASDGFFTEGSRVIHQTLAKQYAQEGQPFTVKHPSPDKPKVVDASHLFRQPHRATRPDHIVVILRGLPGSGKSYLAKMFRDLEVENGGNAPRIHSMDDYFMTEVEKVEESEGSQSSNSIRGKKRITKKVMEYCYEPEMEEAYRSSMLKAFKKTLEEGMFTFIIVDDRNLRVADFAQFWASAKRSGYEVYLVEATYKDPMGCAARNVHGFTADDIQKMADRWEEAPPMYLQLDIQSLFHGDDLKENGIEEVDMDMEDVACDESASGLQDNKSQKLIEPPVGDYAPDGSLKDGERWNTEGDDPTELKELGQSKWSDDVDGEDTKKVDGAKSNSNALSGLVQAYGKGDKSVHWGDQAGRTGFSIGAAKRPNVLPLVIGPGAGYNLKSNPLPEEEKPSASEMDGESKRRSVFQEQLRAERESFRVVFDRRRQRIGGLEVEDE